MELLTGLACVFITIVLAFTIYFILVSSMKEKTYDEVKAEQKKKAEEYFAQGRTAKEKAKDKKLKKAGKKVKEKTSFESIEVSSDEVDTSKGHVVFVDTPIVVDEESSVVSGKHYVQLITCHLSLSLIYCCLHSYSKVPSSVKLHLSSRGGKLLSVYRLPNLIICRYNLMQVKLEAYTNLTLSKFCFITMQTMDRVCLFSCGLA